MPRRTLASLLLILLPLLTGARPGELELEDVLQLLLIDRALLAVDAEGSDLRLELELGEQVLHYEAQGRVGVAFTDRRILAVAVGSAAWQVERLRIGERLTETPLLGDRVALILTDVRALGFDGGSGNLVEQRFGPREAPTLRAVSSSVAVVVTGRRALGLSPFRGGFFEVDLRPDEARPTLRATGNVATLETPTRLLTFDARSGRWVERDFRFLR